MKALIFKLLVLFSLITVLISCVDDIFENRNPIEFTEIAIGSLSGSGIEGIQESQLVISNTADWENLMVQMNCGTYYFKETDIDFQNFKVIAIFDKIQPYYCYSVEIDKITENDTRIIIYYNQISCDSGFAAMSQPFVIVKIPNIKKQIIFKKTST